MSALISKSLGRGASFIPRSLESHATGFSRDARKGRRSRPWQWLRLRSLLCLRPECLQRHDDEEIPFRRGTPGRGIHQTERRAKYVVLTMHRRLRAFDACMVSGGLHDTPKTSIRGRTVGLPGLVRLPRLIVLRSNPPNASRHAQEKMNSRAERLRSGFCLVEPCATG